MKNYIFILGILTHFSIEAASTKQKEINFRVHGEDLIRGDVHYSMAIVPRSVLKDKMPEFLELDTIGFSRDKEISLLVSKSAYVVNQPIGFFDDQKSGSLKFLDHILGEQTLKEISQNHFLVTIPGSSPISYKLRTYFDSDDISTSSHSKSIRAIMGAKKMDIQVQGASAVYVRENSEYSKGSKGSVQVTAFIILKENKTLIIEYNLMSLIPPLLSKDKLRKNIAEEVTAHQKLIDSFKAE